MFFTFTRDRDLSGVSSGLTEKHFLDYIFGVVSSSKQSHNLAHYRCFFSKSVLEASTKKEMQLFCIFATTKYKYIKHCKKRRDVFFFLQKLSKDSAFLVGTIARKTRDW